jgi:tRNA (guanine-N7-)-methyltransferase
LFHTANLYRCNKAEEILSIQTYYERQWIERGMAIKYIRFLCEERNPFVEPDIEIEPDDYRSRRSSP